MNVIANVLQLLNEDLSIFLSQVRGGVYCTVQYRRFGMCAGVLFAVRASLFFFILVLPSQVNNTPAYLMRSAAGCASAHPPFTFMLGRVQTWEAIFRYFIHC